MQTSGVDLKIENLGRHFGERVILDHFSLEIEAGEFVSLLGASGSGKSTLLRLISGLDVPNRGQITISTNATKSFVFQDSNLLPWRTLRQNLELVYELTHQELNKNCIDEILELVGLQNDSFKYPNQLSGGMRMRTSVARALMTRPQLLLLDEPFSALDENTRHRLQEELYAIWLKQKMTIIFVTHSISEAVFLSERAIVLGGQPTGIALDHHIDLPIERNDDLRTSQGYISQLKLVSKSFAK